MGTLAGSAETVSGKETGEGVRLGRLFFHLKAWWNYSCSAPFEFDLKEMYARHICHLRKPVTALILESDELSYVTNLLLVMPTVFSQLGYQIAIAQRYLSERPTEAEIDSPVFVNVCKGATTNICPSLGIYAWSIRCRNTVFHPRIRVIEAMPDRICTI